MGGVYKAPISRLQKLTSPPTRIGLGIIVEVPYTQTNSDHALRVTLQDEDGTLQPLRFISTPDGTPTPEFEFIAQFNFSRPPSLIAGDSQTIPIAINFDGLIFPNPGMYRWNIEVNGSITSTNSMRLSLNEISRK